MHNDYHYSMHRSRANRNVPLWAVIILDVLITGLCLVVFAYFHHVKPVESSFAPVSLSTPSPVVTASPSPTPAPTVQAGTTQTPAVEATPTPIPVDQGMWGEKFADKFIAGQPVITENSYKSEDISLSIERVEKDGVTYFVADIYLRNIENFKSGFANGQYGRGNSQSVVDILAANRGILGISGDYYGMRAEGIVARNGVLYRDTPFRDVLVMYNDGSMQTFGKNEFDLAAQNEAGIYQIWAFGPMLLKDGQPMESFDSDVNPRNPRSSIGYYEPGHYCFVTVDGRQDGYSVGLTLKELSQLYADLGCKVAYNLDGGQTAVMAFNGSVVNQPYKGGRDTSDILFIAEAE